MSMRVLVKDAPHRALALATDDHVLIFRHTHTSEDGQDSGTNLSSPITNQQTSTTRCMVEFAARTSVDLTNYRQLTSGRGTLGLITLHNDVFICIVTGSMEVATIRPGETVQKIYAVEFYCLNRSDYDHGQSQGLGPNPYPGQTFTSDEFEYGGGMDQSETYAEHPFHALKKLLSGGNFYYSVDFDLTRRLQDRADSEATVDIASLNEGLLWNSYMIDPLIQFRSRLTNHERQALDSSRMLTSVIRGFARTIQVPASSSPIRRKVSSAPGALTVVSRLSSRRAGTRFNSRGLDDNGNVANFVETETIFWSPAGLCFSYTQVRGSVPIFWESTSSLIPGQQKISITRSPEATQPSFDKHFSGLEQIYGAIHIVNLLSASKPGEVELTERYRYHVNRSPLKRPQLGDVEEHALLQSTEFDFHERTRGAIGYDGARAIRPYIENSADAFVYFLTEDITEDANVHGSNRTITRPVVIMQQNGVFRVNCLDCLDRTNLVQGMLSQMALEAFLDHRQERSNSDFWMRHSTLWADNGDALSKIYAGTGALKSSFTRHGKMSLAGALADARKSATRLYVNHFEDKGRQNTVDLLLGRLVGQTSVDLFDPVNDWVVAELNRRRAEFESRDQLNVLVGTYNLNGKTTGVREDLSPWLSVHNQRNAFDVIAIGFQEIVELSPQQIMSTDPNRRMLWESAVRKCLNDYDNEKEKPSLETLGGDDDDYVLLRSGQLVGAALLIFVRSSLLPRIRNVEGSLKKTGMSGIAGNKGAVAVRMEIDSTSICFVTAHLAAGFGNYEERNRDYNTIVSGLRFQRDRSIDDHEVVIWAGDFNYRVGLGYERAKSLVQNVMAAGILDQPSSRHGKQSADRTSVAADAEASLEKLYENDQLNIQMVVGACFQYYREGPVRFLPTYKFDLGKDEYDSSEKQRIPAWTDRILWKVNQKTLSSGEESRDRVKQLDYNSVMSLRFSDHRPVYATFELGIKVVDEDKKGGLERTLYRKRAAEVGGKFHDQDMTSGMLSGDGLDDDSSSEDFEELAGYQSVQEGLPPASSDRRKWWLDGDRAARSDIQPPEAGTKLNRLRADNPWKSNAEDDWVKIEKPDVESVTKNGDRKSQSGTEAKAIERPELPPPRGVTKRMVPPVWEGGRIGLPKNDGTSDMKTGKQALPDPPRSGEADIRLKDRVVGEGLPSPNTSSKKPPPKPVKPTALTSTPSSSSTPTVSRMSSLSRPDISSKSPTPSRTNTFEKDETESAPPPLPKRTNTASSVASVTSNMSATRNLPPPVQPRNISKLQQGASRPRDGSISSISSIRSNESGPPLPPRRAPTNPGLMDNDTEEGELKTWQALKPQ